VHYDPSLPNYRRLRRSPELQLGLGGSRDQR